MGVHRSKLKDDYVGSLNGMQEIRDDPLEFLQEIMGADTSRTTWERYVDKAGVY